MACGFSRRVGVEFVPKSAYRARKLGSVRKLGSFAV